VSRRPSVHVRGMTRQIRGSKRAGSRLHCDLLRGACVSIFLIQGCSFLGPADRLRHGIFLKQNHALDAWRQVTKLTCLRASHGGAIADSVVEDLHGVLRGMNLESYAAAGAEWCTSQGAATLEEILENYDDFAAALQLGVPERDSLHQNLMRVVHAPSQALVSSRTLRGALKFLVNILESEQGAVKFNSMVQRFINELKESRQVLDWESVLGSDASWDENVFPRDEAVLRLTNAMRLLTIGNNLADELEVTTVTGASMDIRMAFSDANAATISLSRSPDIQRWGQWSSYYIGAGPGYLFGKRLVAIKRQSQAPVFGPSGAIDFHRGDLLYVAEPDRAAFLELATFDQLPEMSIALAQLVKQLEADPGSATQVADALSAPPKMLEAANFWNRLQSMSDDDAKVDSRLRRLQDEPLVQDINRLVADDEDWSTLAKALEPWFAKIYAAVRAVTPMVPAVEPQQITEVRVNWVSVIITLLLISSLIFFAVQSFNKNDVIGSEDLPLYSLEGSEKKQMVPLLRGTALMPFGN